jgi:hypothetical protein
MNDPFGRNSRTAAFSCPRAGIEPLHVHKTQNQTGHAAQILRWFFAPDGARSEQRPEPNWQSPRLHLSLMRSLRLAPTPEIEPHDPENDQDQKPNLKQMSEYPHNFTIETYWAGKASSCAPAKALLMCSLSS